MNAIICPACDFERRSPGKPVQNGDRMICQDCGTSWRELGEVHNQNHAVDEKAFASCEPSPVARRSSAISGGLFLRKKPVGGFFTGHVFSPVFTLTAIASIVFLVSLALSVMLIRAWQPLPPDPVVTGSVSSDRIAITGIRLEETVRADGTGVVTVRGTLLNRSSKVASLPRVAIRLVDQQQNELVRWYFSPPVSSIAGKRSLQFASSIQHDRASGATAKVRFE